MMQWALNQGEVISQGEIPQVQVTTVPQPVSEEAPLVPHVPVRGPCLPHRPGTRTLGPCHPIRVVSL